MFANKNIFHQSAFLYSVCLAVFALSIFIRSIIDIGPDTGIYLDLGKKVFEGKKYYYDFFESNFPLSFYFYAFQYWVSIKTAISPIILSEIFINLLALLSIFASAKILKKSTIFENKAHFNLIIISYFLGFFLRPVAITIGEFGTKTSLLLILLYPYISYSFTRLEKFTKFDFICRGLLMGVIPCLKIHYLILILPVEIYRFWQKKQLSSLFELDKLIMALIGSLGLFLMLKFTPEYFEFMPPMWKYVYSPYSDLNEFLQNSLGRLANILQYSLLFVIFARQKLTQNDKILAIFFASVSLLIILENIGTIDQGAVFYSIVTTCFLKFIFDFYTAYKTVLKNNLFIICSLIFLPAFEMDLLPKALISVGGIINMWWIAAWYYLAKSSISKKDFLLFYCCALLLIIFSTMAFGPFCYVVLNLLFLLIALFIFEKKSSLTSYSRFSIFVIFISISSLLYIYISSISNIFTKDKLHVGRGELSQITIYYNRKYAPQKDQSFLMVSLVNYLKFPVINFLQKENLQKFHTVFPPNLEKKSIYEGLGENNKSDYLFTYHYLLDDFYQALNNDKNKLIFFNNSPFNLNKKDRCFITSLEYYLRDPKFRKKFLQNFEFENHLILLREKDANVDIDIFYKNNTDIFDSVKASPQQIFYDFEVYVRK